MGSHINCHEMTPEQAHVHRIWLEKGGDLTSPSTVVEDLHGSVQTLAQQLYSKPTHFLLELLQNADDNEYDDKVDPEVYFLLGREPSGELFFQVNCNERGFTEENVKSICRVKQSTKAQKDGYIGEKGIGFKSVFRVADVVFITSGGYSFSFDAMRVLGMISPMNEPYPSPHRISGWTQIYLRLKTKAGDTGNVASTIEEQLRAIDGRLLVFLRKLKSISIRVDLPSSQWQRFLKCKNHTQHGGEAVQLRSVCQPKRGSNNTIEQLLIVRHVVTGMTPTDDRANVTSSEIVLGFPLDTSSASWLYAFLPVNIYGFPFLVQADFLLTADRANVEEGKQWNVELRDRIAQVFHIAVDHLLLTDLKYTWPRYLPPRSLPASPFFSGAATMINDEIAKRRILLSRGQSLQVPRRLMIVPNHLRLSGTGQPFFDQHQHRYLSDAYDRNDRVLQNKLREMGVTTMDFAEFSSHLMDFVKEHPDTYKAMPDTWHSSLAQVLMANPWHRSSKLNTLPLIPLDNGSWASRSSAQSIYFQSADRQLQIPPGLSFKVVISDASKDNHRRQLLQSLGVKQLNSNAVVDMLLEMHTRSNVPQDMAGLLKQTIFCFRVYQHGSSSFAAFSKLKIWSSAGRLCSARDGYKDSQTAGIPKLSALYATSPAGTIEMMASDYMNAVHNQDLDAWHRWLESKVGIQIRPRWRRDNDEEERPSPEIIWLYLNKSLEFFKLFQSDRDGCTRKTFKIMSEWKVKPRNGGESLPLKSMFASNVNTQLLKDNGTDLLPYLRMDTSDIYRWACLRDLHVTVEAGLSFWLEVLKACKTFEQSMEKVTQAYEEIQKRASSNRRQVMETFASQPLVLLVREDGHRSWKQASACRWQAPSCFVLKPSLAQKYPKLQALFKEYLGVVDSARDDLLNELKEVSRMSQLVTTFEASEIIRVKRLLVELTAAFVAGMKWSPTYDNLYIFPGVAASVAGTFHRYRDLIVPDLREVSKVFGNKLPWHDIDVRLLDKLQPLLSAADHFQPRSMLLSHRMIESSRYSGKTEPSQVYLDILGSKGPFICSLVEPKARPTAEKLFQDLSVLGAESITLARTALSPSGHRVQGEDDIGYVVFDTQTSTLVVSSENLAQMSVPQNEVARALSQACGIHQEDKIRLVQDILQYADVKKNRMLLEAKGFSVPNEEADSEEECYEDHVGEPVSRYTDPYIFDDDKQTSECQTMAGLSEDSEYCGQIYESLPVRTTSQPPLLKPISTPSWSQTFPELPPSLAPSERILEDFFVAKPPSRRKRQGQGDQAAGLSKQSQSNFNPRTLASRLQINDLTADEADVGVRSGASGRNLTRRQAGSLAAPKETVRSDSQVENDQLIGIGGEQAMFDFLMKHVNNFNENCWTSSMRNSVEHMTPFTGDDREHTDFTFQDSGGRWTSYLVGRGLPGALDWQAGPPRYHIEVKTTMGDLHTPFFMSHNELEMARTMTAGDETQPSDVYLLARVYNLNSGEPRVKIFDNPWVMQQEERLWTRSCEMQVPPE